MDSGQNYWSLAGWTRARAQFAVFAAVQSAAQVAPKFTAVFVPQVSLAALVVVWRHVVAVPSTQQHGSVSNHVW